MSVPLQLALTLLTTWPAVSHPDSCNGPVGGRLVPVVDGAGEMLAATMSADTIIVAVPGHTYKFQAVATY